MFAVEIGETRFEYDVQALVKAFYPEENVRVMTPNMGEEKRAEAEKALRLKVEFLPDGARVSFFLPPAMEDSGAERAVDKSYVWQAQEGDRESKGYKTEFKRFFYNMLSEYTKKTLPWGSLTGIRPTKIAMGLLENGKSGEEVISYMQKEYFVSRNKAELSVEIAEREKKLLSRIHYADGYSLYIGIPFCPTTCLYCSFTSYPLCKFERLVEDYIDCLIKELRFVGEMYRNKVLDSVYIGGGTPTTLNPAQLDRLLAAIREHFDFSTVQEFTVEAGRADSITEEKLAVLKKHGVGRISINPQTMKEETLKLIGRQATPKQVKEAFAMARAVGGFNINMDIILGLPGEGEADVKNTIEEITAMQPDSLTVHSLAIKRASHLSKWILDNGIESLKNTDKTMEIAAQGAAGLHMHPYYLYRQKNMSGNFENVGYATEGNYGLYNILIMEEKQTIIACGAGSITKAVYPDGRIERMDNVKDVTLYIEKIDEMIERKRKLLTDYAVG
ncbi:MAG: coproporphyrinogen dehydrogenase HemZ [Lachnospiraceae bacterium]|nr:coproporphyrinogen dehydrogenase HemZ [Lachnospiraceae bacterium]